MEYTFRAEKMIARIKKEGRAEMLTDETVAYINSLDGKVGTDYNWQSVAMGEENMVYIADENTYVNKLDCDIGG